MDFIDFIAAERRQESSTVIVYSRAQLLDLAHTALLLPGEKFDIPDELKRRRRGRRAGLKCKAKRRRFKYKPAIPSIIMGNVRCLHNKMDELAGLVRGQRIYRETSLMCFTETWLNDNIPIQNVTIDGFQTIRADRDRVSSGKSKGGGLALLVNNRWCHPNHITLKEKFCSPDIELLAVSLRPYYLPREFTAAIAVIVYIPPSADANAACDIIHSVIARLQTAHPSAFFAISGDFNHASLSSTLPTFKQFVKCPTRNNTTLDLLYANVKDAYNSTALPPLGRSDHNLVHLTPLYRPLVQQQPATTRTIRRWSPEANEALQDCFETTDWDVLCEAHGEDIDGLTDCITDYINFCVDNTVPTRKVRCFPNNKPWVTSDLKALLNEKKRAFKEGDKDKLKCVQRELKLWIAERKRGYKEKMEDKLRQSQSQAEAHYKGSKHAKKLKAQETPKHKTLKNNSTPSQDRGKSITSSTTTSSSSSSSSSSNIAVTACSSEQPVKIGSYPNNLYTMASSKPLFPAAGLALVPSSSLCKPLCEPTPASPAPEMPKHALNKPTPAPAVPATPAPCEASNQSEEEKAKKLLHCWLCKVAVNSLSQLEAHNTGSKHKTMLEARDGAGPIKAYPRPGAKLKVQATIAKGSGLQNKTFHCEICDVHVNSEIQLKQHISSRRHKDRVAGKPLKPKYSPYSKQQHASSTLAAKLAFQKDLVKPLSQAFLSSPFIPTSIPSISLHPRPNTSIFQTAALPTSFLRAAPGPIRPTGGSILFAPY